MLNRSLWACWGWTMIGDFLFHVRGLVSFEAEHGVPARLTPFGFLMPDYQQDNEGMDLWEKQFGEKAKGTTRFAIPPSREVRIPKGRTV